MENLISQKDIADKVQRIRNYIKYYYIRMLGGYLSVETYSKYKEDAKRDLEFVFEPYSNEFSEKKEMSNMIDQLLNFENILQKRAFHV